MNKTILTLALLTAFCVSACQKGKLTDEPIKTKLATEQKQSTENDLVRINYRNKINGYEVNVIWKPQNERYGNISGPAILEFKKGEVSFTVTNNYFSIPTEAFESMFTITDGLVTEIKTNNVILNYQEPNLNEGKFEEDRNLPFLFIDLNFDGIKELLITKVGQGQRDIDAFDVYALDSSGDLEPSYAQITNQEPYNELDTWVTINKRNKELIFYGSGGVCYNRRRIYSAVYNENYGSQTLVLTKIIQEERDDNAGKCYELTYSIKNGVSTLISKKEIDQ